MKKKDSTAVMSRRNIGNTGLDDYPTPPWATRILTEWGFNNITLAAPIKKGLHPLAGKTIWEPAANRGYMVRVLQETGATVLGTDIKDYGAGFSMHDFLNDPPNREAWKLGEVDWIITNPPFRLGEEFFMRAKQIAKEGVALLLRIQWAESKGRVERIFLKTPPAAIIFPFDRITMAEGKLIRGNTGATLHCWFIWTRAALKGMAETRMFWCPLPKKTLERPGDYD